MRPTAAAQEWPGLELQCKPQRFLLQFCSCFLWCCWLYHTRCERDGSREWAEVYWELARVDGELGAIFNDHSRRHGAWRRDWEPHQLSPRGPQGSQVWHRCHH